jgi:glycosyltransferase involved in cell wall biosynthesis
MLVLASSGWGGTEKAVVDLANALVEIGPVSVVVPKGAQYVGRLSEDVVVLTLPGGSRRNPLTIVRLAWLIRSAGPDVIHAHAARAAEMVYRGRRLHAAPIVGTKHNTRPRRIFSSMQWVTAVSETACASVDHPGVTLVYNGVRHEALERRPKPGMFTILGVGRLHTHKGFDALLQALAPLSFDWRLDLAGEGPERGALKVLTQELGLGDRVTLLGHREDVAALAASAHVQVVSSRTEGFGLALVEGLLHCDVVLSTPVGVAQEILPDELIVPLDALGERISDVRDRYDSYVALTTKSRETLGDRFSMEKARAGYLEVYRRAMAG